MSASLQVSPLEVPGTLKDHIYGVLLDGILNMNIYDEATDLRLDERDLAQRLGVSRTPLREALARLEQEGFITIVPRRGVHVCRKSRQEILEMVVAWAALESMAARLACDNASDTDLASLHALAQQNSAASASADPEAYAEANIEFHRRILALSNVNLLTKICNGLFLHMKAVRRRTMTESNRAAQSVAEHEAIIKALESRDADLTSQLVREHTMRLHHHIAANWPETGAPETGVTPETNANPHSSPVGQHP